MRSGHADAQFMFAQIGRARGHAVRRTWTRELPTDGVWLAGGLEVPVGEIPVAALEVVVTEGPKAMKGSLDTLCEVSPGVGILMINDRDIRQNLVRKGVPIEDIRRRLDRQFQAVSDRLQRCQQRILLWNYQTLSRHYHLLTGSSTLPLLDRIASKEKNNA